MTEQVLITKPLPPNRYIARFDRCRIIQKRSKSGNPFSLFEYFVVIETESQYQGMEFRGTMNVERAKRYFNFCNIHTSHLLGKLVQVTLGEREYINNGERESVIECKYLNCLKSNGDPIIMW